MPVVNVKLDLPPREAHPNARSDWRRRAAAIAKYRKACGEIAFAVRLEAAADYPLPGAVVGLQYCFAPAARGKKLREHDPDNLIAWAKAAIDGLVDGGVFADDRLLAYLPPTSHVAGSFKLACEFPCLWVGIHVGGICPLCGGDAGFSLIREPAKR